MMNDGRMLKDELNAMHVSRTLKSDLSQKNTKDGRKMLKLHTKVQGKIEEGRFNDELNEELAESVIRDNTFDNSLKNIYNYIFN
mmetsp:Transcript_77446/g.167502  ORF Transcript_77446/g.167502 Transcript_77446/m.167502 type:complete len:84 (+) Transcript_77446:805-1056(+)